MRETKEKIDGKQVLVITLIFLHIVQYSFLKSAIFLLVIFSLPLSKNNNSYKEL